MFFEHSPILYVPRMKLNNKPQTRPIKKNMANSEDCLDAMAEQVTETKNV